MKLIVVGAGDIGTAIASQLSQEHHDIVLVDRDRAKIERAGQDLDIATRVGSGTDWHLLEELKDLEPQILIALTDDDETNLVCCSIAKALGYPQTMARVRESGYLSQTRIDCGRLFSVDHFVSPEMLATQDICKHVLSLGSKRVENFALGAVQMRTLILPPRWKKREKLSDLGLPKMGVMAALVARSSVHGKQEIIFPHGNDVFLPGDELTLIGQTEPMREIHTFFGIDEPRAKSVVLVGGGLIGFNTAKALLHQGLRVRVIERDRHRCALLSERLPQATIIHHDGTDLHFLQEEKVNQADVFVACTRNDEVNVLATLLAKEVGCKQTIALVAETRSSAMLGELGISHLISPRTATANRVVAIAHSGLMSATSSLYDNRAKVLELKVSMDSKIVGIPLATLGPHLPKDFLLAIIQNRGRTMIADGGRILCPGDTVVMVTSPKNTDQILELF